MELQAFNPVLTAINIVAACVILWKGIFHVVNHMSKHTSFAQRWAWIFMITGAFAVVVGPFFGIIYASGIITLIHVGVAMFVLSDRRIWGV